MKNNRYYVTSLIAVAMLAGCASTPKVNSSLDAAHHSYDIARSDAQVTKLAPAELKEAGDSLNQADMALSKGQGANKVNHLAYMAKQQVAIAEQTARRKAGEITVANAAAQRNQVQLDARTAEADAARQQVAMAKVTTDQQAAALSAAGNNAEIDQALIAQQQMQLKALNAKKTARGMVITLGDVLFSTNKSQLASGGIRNVQQLADFLKEFGQHKVMIEGFTDSTGTNDYNQKLSVRRADAVRLALLDMGINSDRIMTRGYGEMFPVANNKTAAGRQQNRRVEIIISDENGKIASR
ncbi:MAG: flagellar motor protein MotB [Zetaproteobacteria bacterium CG_4_9_14_3_um_filter_49_83]|nr:MAG: flagellar motor protein MotB [Zetaproteobacteria bacterium CG1_02_49_23]PIQ30556.1 MAG: flagellar motor protein MotB [Zetaproteobacteria bacterium CG17_big_fil_post_rev_8_21_14_2_50_50_13]PIV31319.1 MAG: flagellar motor protein MotB [Zetaproteobacteria bacterium CG02_land_8_20_14_3_00_50_9]PIY55128.1 MAG: flagellar motor protein MotB [Zetaproteobacteria bacterium CG_4_10_14_0_8_um_filter_49_80]PJA35789.1 MAG: flagellar motor protein MotB [Zetaproteobacteria bacterium CG_4_9_14_3_um_filt